MHNLNFLPHIDSCAAMFGFRLREVASVHEGNGSRKNCERLPCRAGFGGVVAVAGLEQVPDTCFGGLTLAAGGPSHLLDTSLVNSTESIGGKACLHGKGKTQKSSKNDSSTCSPRGAGGTYEAL